MRCFDASKGAAKGAPADELASARDLPGGLAAPFCVEAGLREGRKAGPLGSRPLGSSRDVRSEAEVRSYVLNTPASGSDGLVQSRQSTA